MAKLVGISQQMIADYEKGKKMPTIVTGVDLARKLDTTVERLVDGGDEKTDKNTYKRR